MKATAEQVVEAYKQTGSVWATAKRLGMCGQSVWERLRAIGHDMQSTKWTPEEVAELRVLIVTHPIAKIAEALGRPYAGVACKASELGIVTRVGNKIKRKVPHGSGLTERVTKRLLRTLNASGLSIREFCRTNSITMDSFALAVQTHAPDAWRAISAQRGIPTKQCVGCGTDFYPMTQNQTACTRRCADRHRSDRTYFGGKRNTAIGMAEGICQLCQQRKTSKLAAHHIIGKENDPENLLLVALCNGCHRLVGILAGRHFADDPKAWERLIEFSMARRLSLQSTKYSGTHVSVDMEYLTLTELSDLGLVDEP